MPKKGWGIIGASTIAREYMIRAINAQQDSRAVAVMSRSMRRGRRLAQELNVERIYDNLDALLSDPEIDVIYISSTNERHKEETVAAAAAGKHVLCEKPLALTLSDARKMIHACEEAGVIMGTNHHLRNAVTHRKLRSLIRRGAIGRPLAARVFHAVSLPQHLRTWRINNPDAGAGVVLDITVHDTDTLRFILEDEVVEVSAQTASQGMAHEGIEDAVMGVMRFRRGVMAQFHDAFTIAHAGTGLEIHGTEGSLFAENVMTQRPVGRIYRRVNNKKEVITLGPSENLYTRAVRLFNRALDGLGEPSATANDGLRSLAVALSVLESAKTGMCIKVRYG